MRKCTNTIFSLIIISLFPCITLNKSTKTKPTLRRKTTIDELLYTSNNLEIHTALLKKTSGSNWKMWDRNSTYTTTLSSISKEQRCDWARFRVNGYVADMCTHGDDEVLSKVIKSHGRWGECDLLTVLWHDYTRKSVFVDAGANIGSCVLHMLFTTSASILAFEPHPRNLFCLTSTLMKLDKQYRNRVFLFPIALGSESKISKMTGLENNLGHSMIYNKPLNEQYHSVINIPVERLDSILSIEAHIELMKLDVEGYECNVLEGMGMGALLQQTKVIYTEVNDHYLHRNNCSKQLYHCMLEASDFILYDKIANLFPSVNHFRTREFLSEYNIVAKKFVPIV